MQGKVTNWSAENATKAFLKTLKMGNNNRPITEPDASEFISAIAAGNDAHLMVAMCSKDMSLKTQLALVAAAHQTGALVVFISRDLTELQSTMQAISQENVSDLTIEFVIGDAERLILEDYKEVDFVLNDCKLGNHEAIVRVVQFLCRKRSKGAVVLGCNAFCSSSSSQCAVGRTTKLLPIGEGLLMTEIPAGANERIEFGRKSHWVVKLDQRTGEEHVFRIICPNGMDMNNSGPSNTNKK